MTDRTATRQWPTNDRTQVMAALVILDRSGGRTRTRTLDPLIKRFLARVTHLNKDSWSNPKIVDIFWDYRHRYGDLLVQGNII